MLQVAKQKCGMSIVTDFLEHLPFLLERFAVAVAAISGVLAGRGKNVDLFGVIVLGLVTALGGGTLRDVMVGDLPLVWIHDPSLVTTATVAAICAFVALRYFELPQNLLLIADAFAMALMTIIGTRKALGFQVEAPIAVAMGVITGVAGGIIRDVLTGEVPLVFRPHIHLYATAALLGATVYVLMMRAGLPPQPALLAGTAVTLILRLAAMRWKLRLPMLAEPPER